MKVRTIWNKAVIPIYCTNDEQLTTPCDAPTIGELFQKAASGEDISEYDYRSDDLSEHDESYVNDVLYSDEYNDPLLRKTLLKQLHDDVKEASAKQKSRKSRKKTTDKADDHKTEEPVEKNSPVDEGGEQN